MKDENVTINLDFFEKNRKKMETPAISHLQAW